MPSLLEVLRMTHLIPLESASPVLGQPGGARQRNDRQSGLKITGAEV